MPHISIKHFPGNFSEETKTRLAKRISLTISEELQCSQHVISVLMEAIDENRWEQEVYLPEIKNKQSLLLKHPNY